MLGLDDIFSEDIVDEPDNIERVVDAAANEGYDGSGRDSGNEEVKNEEENAKEKVKIKRTLGPRPTINVQRLKGPRGIGIMQSFFSDLKFKGKKHEEDDLKLLMSRLEHWAHRLCPRMQFDEALKKMEKLGAKREVYNYVKRIRLGMEENVESESVVENEPLNSVPDVDPFDQIMASTDVTERSTSVDMTEEQRDKMLQNRLKAEEIRAARIKRAQELKAKFLENQKLSQRDSSPTAVSDTKAKNQENELERSPGSLQEEQMEIDENLTPESVSVFNTVNVNEENEATEEQRDKMLQNRLKAEEIRVARIRRAQELKAKFLENQKLSQRDSSPTAVSKTKAKNQENELERPPRSLQEEQMKIDENLTPESVSVFNTVNVNEENVSNFQSERNCSTSNLAEKDKENSPNLRQIDSVEHDIPMESLEKNPGVLMERNKAQPDIIKLNGSSTAAF